jgi:hypothetical protein
MQQQIAIACGQNIEPLLLSIRHPLFFGFLPRIGPIGTLSVPLNARANFQVMSRFDPDIWKFLRWKGSLGYILLRMESKH